MKYEVTLKDLRQAGACYSGYNKVVRALQGKPFTEEDEERKSYVPYAHDKPIPIISILESNGPDDAIWALRCVKNADRDIRLFGVWCARQVQHLMDDRRAITALDVAERFSRGEASGEELVAARDAAREASSRTGSVDAALAAAWAALAESAGDAAWDAARAAGDAALDAALAAERAALAESAGDAAWAAAWAATRAPQEEMLKRMCQGKAEWQTVKALVTH